VGQLAKVCGYESPTDPASVGYLSVLGEAGLSSLRLDRTIGDV